MNESDSKYLRDKVGIPNRGLYFTSEHGFFVAWEWAKKQEWWIEFLSELNEYLGTTSCSIPELYHIPVDLIGPRFAEELVAFLKEREK